MYIYMYMYMLYHRCEVYISFIHTEPEGEVSEYKVV